MNSNFYTLHFIVLLAVAVSVNGYLVKVDAHSEECFHDKIAMGTTFTIIFEVAEGGFLDIDLKVRHAIHSKLF